jgi:acyl-CoA thioesterase-1
MLLAGLFLLFSCNNSSTPENKENPVPTSQGVSAENKSTAKKNILFFGNSLTAAYGLDPSQGYVALIQQRLDSLSLPYKAINAGLSGETTAGGKERVDWVIKQPVDIFVLELGGNDALRGIETSASYENLGAIIEKVRSKYPQAKIILAGMEAPPNMGPDYTSKFRKMYPDLAKKHQTALIPFFLEGIGGVPELNQQDRIHPNEKGQFVLRENVWKVLQPLL